MRATDWNSQGSPRTSTRSTPSSPTRRSCGLSVSSLSAVLCSSAGKRGAVVQGYMQSNDGRGALRRGGQRIGSRKEPKRARSGGPGEPERRGSGGCIGDASGHVQRSGCPYRGVHCAHPTASSAVSHTPSPNLTAVAGVIAAMQAAGRKPQMRGDAEAGSGPMAPAAFHTFADGPRLPATAVHSLISHWSMSVARRAHGPLSGSGGGGGGGGAASLLVCQLICAGWVWPGPAPLSADSRSRHAVRRVSAGQRSSSGSLRVAWCWCGGGGGVGRARRREGGRDGEGGDGSVRAAGERECRLVERWIGMDLGPA